MINNPDLDEEIKTDASNILVPTAHNTGTNVLLLPTFFSCKFIRNLVACFKSLYLQYFIDAQHIFNC